MRVASTGLGSTELYGEVFDFKRNGDLLILHLNTEEPAKWHLRAALEQKDVYPLLKGFAKPSALWFLIRSVLFPKKNLKEPETIIVKKA